MPITITTKRPARLFDVRCLLNDGTAISILYAARDPGQARKHALNRESVAVVIRVTEVQPAQPARR